MLVMYKLNVLNVSRKIIKNKYMLIFSELLQK